MRLLWWRGKKAQQAEAPRRGADGANIGVAEPSQFESLDPLLAFARDFFVARGARVRQEGDKIIHATQPGGTTRMLTSSVATARDHADAELLVAGGPALNEIVEACAVEARVSALQLASSRDVAEIVRSSVAAPAASCGECATRGPAETDAHCEQCPLRECKLALQGMDRIRRVVERRRASAWSAEVTFEITARDRDGRLDDTVRLAIDVASGKPVPLLSFESLAHATGAALPPVIAETLTLVLDRADAALRVPMGAAATFQSLRAEADYLARRDEITATFDSLLREPLAEARDIERALASELQRLDETFGVSVEAAPASVAFVSSEHVDVVVERHGGRDVALTCDAGRGIVLPPACSLCASPATSGSVCAEAHVICSACLSRHDVSEGCRACDGTSMLPSNSDIDLRPHVDERELSSRTVAALPDHIWHACARWLAERMGVRAEQVQDHSTGLVLRGEKGGSKVCICAPRSAREWGISPDEVRRAAAQVVGEPGVGCMLLAPRTATTMARVEANRLGVELWDAAVIDEIIERAATSYEHERRAAEEHRERCIALLSSIRSEGTSALEEAETYLAVSTGGDRYTDRSHIARAATDSGATSAALLQALVAWDTVVADYQSATLPRPGRDGALDLVGDVPSLRGVLDRVRHLSRITVDSARQLGQMAPSGDFGYTEWRKTLVDELTCRCESVRWRLLALNLEHASEFTKAHDGHATEKAEASALAAERAAARRAQAFATLERRARL